MTDRLIKWSTAFAVVCVAAVAAVVSYGHAYALVVGHGESGLTARLVPLTVDGLIFASSMVILHAARRGAGVPQLARWLLGLGIAATLAANALHGLDHGPIGAIVAAWPAVALVGSYELLMLIIRRTVRVDRSEPSRVPDVEPVPADVPAVDLLLSQAIEAFSEDMSTGTIPSIRKIRSTLRVGQPKAQQVRAHLVGLNGNPANGTAERTGGDL